MIVVGAGHAGCEAALASARMGHPTLLLTITLEAVARMSCNPAIGGLAKGQLVKEIDALGGGDGQEYRCNGDSIPQVKYQERARSAFFQGPIGHAALPLADEKSPGTSEKPISPSGIGG